MTEIQIIDYLPAHEAAFRKLNEAWIRKYFQPEEEDKRTLENPGKIIAEGGYILICAFGAPGIGYLCPEKHLR